jgi:transposase InsO family protein
MPGQPITSLQAQLYMEHRETLGQAGAAAKAGISERSARRLDRRGGALPVRPVRDWRTRDDPLAEVWEPVVVPLLRREEGKLLGTTVLQHLQRLYPGKYPDGLLRTVQRRVSGWKLKHGPAPDLIFTQAEEPGRIGYSDFTHATELKVVLGGEPFPHLLYQFRLGYSGWCHVQVVTGGESFAALAEGLTSAVRLLGGVPRIHRTDSLSAAFCNLTKAAADDQTHRYQQLCRDLGMQPTRNNLGVSHENGAIESPHGHFKRGLDQALRLRGNRDFANQTAYAAWLSEQVAEVHVRLDSERLAADRAALAPLPAQLPGPAALAREQIVRVSRGATMVVNKVLYTVCDRLAGQQVRVLIFDDRLECYCRGELVETLPRLPRQGNQRQRVVDYRHIIEALARKPGAFPRLDIRDQVHPGPVWKATWEALIAVRDERTAARTYLGLLLLAHRAGCEKALTDILTKHRAAGTLPDLDALRAQFLPRPAGEPPPIVVLIPDANTYDRLLTTVWTHAS